MTGTAGGTGGVLFYVQHLLGIGHLMRATTLVRGMRRQGIPVTLVTGGRPVSVVDTADAEVVQLPSVRATDLGFKILFDENDRQIDDAWRARRRQRLLAVLAETRPRVIMVELFPFGRRQFRFELIPMLEAAQAMRPRPKIVCSVRDILVEKARPDRNVEMVETAERYFDAVLVHGDPDVIGFQATFPLAERIADRLFYTGYVVEPTAVDSHGDGEGEVVVSAGGGGVGRALLRAAVAARPLSACAALPWRLLTGDNLDAETVEDLRGAATDGVIVEPARPDFRALLGRCAVSVSQGGYNTVVEVLSAGARAVIVPYAGGEETEQTLRAKLLKDRGLIELVNERDLSPTVLARAVDTAYRTPPSRLSIRLDGVETTVRLIRDRLAAE